MGRSTRSTVGSVSDKTSVACTNALSQAPQETIPTQQPPKRSSRRLAINNNHGRPSIDSPSNSPKLVKSDTNRAYVATTSTALPTNSRGQTSATTVTRRDVEDLPTVGDLNEKENRPPSTHQTRTRSRKSRSIDRESTIILSEYVTETVESVEKQEQRLIIATQTDDKSPIEPVTETTIMIFPAEGSSIDASQQKERDQQQQKQQVVEDSGASPAVTQEKRKWVRRTKVVNLEDVTTPLQTPTDSKANEEGEDDEDDEEEEENGSSESEDTDGEYGKTSKRLKVVKSVPLFKSTPESELSEYERQRLENIRRNQEMLMSLELPTAVTQLQIATMEGIPSQKTRVSADDLFKDTPKPVRISKQREWKTAPKIAKPIRVSNRIRGVAVTPTMIGENDKVEHGSLSHNDQHNIHNKEPDTSNVDGAEGQDEEDMTNLMSGDLFFDKATRERAIRVDGHYHGWLDPGVIERYGFEKNAKDAWEANGGGSFSFKDPLGLQSDTAGASRSKTAKRPKHEAKMVAKGLFKKNPNAFFYRHNEPGQEQWTGDWTAEEQEIFLKVAAEYGCGDKWGLFASHIPHRVGYQCSNFYRQVVLPEGLVFDPNYEYTSRGKPIYCGKHNQWRK